MCYCCGDSCLRIPSYISPVHVTNKTELHSLAYNVLATQAVIAIDVEWRPGAAEPALLQIATDEHVALIDLLALRYCKESPAILKDILTRDGVIRLGWRFETDLKVLGSWMPCLDAVESYIEVADVVLPVLDPIVTGEGLADCVQRSLGVKLCKKLQCSDWETRPLSDDQVQYAALDAYALLMLMELALHLPEQRLLRRGDLAKYRLPNGSHNGSSKSKVVERFIPRPSGSLASNSEKRQAFINRFCVRTEVYSNCRILSASGKLLAFCDKSKAEWYIAKSIATRVGNDEPLTVQLTFSPEERDDEYDEMASHNPRQNRCVVCGAEKSLSRFHLIPKSYQKYFDVGLKAHQCHDIVLLCVDCREINNRAVMALKVCVAQEMNAPLRGLGRTVPSMQERAVVKAAAALLRGTERIPAARAHELRKIVTDWLRENGEGYISDARALRLDRESLAYAARLGEEIPRRGGWQAAIVLSDEFRPHGEIVVSHLMESGGCDALHEFMVRWREQFVRTMAPRHMPDDWRIDYRIPLRGTERRSNEDDRVLQESLVACRDRLDRELTALLQLN